MRKLILIAILLAALVLSGCDLLEEWGLLDENQNQKQNDDQGDEGQDVEEEEEELLEEEEDVEEEVADEEDDEDEQERELEEKDQDNEEEAELLSAWVLEGDRFLLDTFYPLNPTSTSYVDLPVFEGSEELVNLWSLKVEYDFIQEALNQWILIRAAQTDPDQEFPYEGISVYRLMTSIFEDDDILSVLIRDLTIGGFSHDSKSSKIFFIDRRNGDEMTSSQQLDAWGLNQQEALASLRLFQDEHSLVDFDDLTEIQLEGLYNDDPDMKEEMVALYGDQGSIIINDFSQDPGFLAREIFVAEIDGKPHYIFELIVASLEPNYIDGRYRYFNWTAVPVDYQGGSLERQEDDSGLIEIIYK